MVLSGRVLSSLVCAVKEGNWRKRKRKRKRKEKKGGGGECTRGKIRGAGGLLGYEGAVAVFGLRPRKRHCGWRVFRLDSG